MPQSQYDLIVAGSGAAGLASAVLAHAMGLRPIVIEKTGLIGGTTSYSGGVIWVPNNQQNVARGVRDSVDQAMLYLDSIVGTPHERAARVEYVRRAPEAIAALEAAAGDLFYVRASNSPDYFPDAPGASQDGRAMTPLSFDGRRLGKRFQDIRPPLPELCLFGRQMLELIDVYHLLNLRRSLKSAIHVAGLVLRDARDRVFYGGYGRGTHLTNGNALVARLYKAALDRNIPILRDAPVLDLLQDSGRVSGVAIERDGARVNLYARLGVVLATGGFPWSEKLRERHIDRAPFGYSATSTASTGDGIAMAIDHGAKLDVENTEGAFWTPVSVAERKDGSFARFPHLMTDRAKPGLIAVNRHGRRFLNEAENYHDFGRAMMGIGNNDDQQPVHLLCDADYIGKYPFGAVPPLASERRRAIRSNYLIKAASIDELADKIGVDRAELRGTFDRYNRDAQTGMDREFGKGSSAYNRYLGDGTHKPNPCIAPISRAPFYAIRVHPGDLGTTYGLAADLHSRVLDQKGQPIDGLYACGNDRNSVMAGFYPAGGITIGPALTFAYLAVKHAADANH